MSAGALLEIPADLTFHPHRSAVGSSARTKARGAQHFSDALVVVAVARRREAEVEHAPGGVHVELRDEVKSANILRCRQRGQEHLDDRRRIVRLVASAGAGTVRTALPRPDTGSCSPTTTWTSANA